MNLAGRQGPSGPKVELQFPFYGAVGIDGTAPGLYFLAVGTGTSAPDGADVEQELSFLVPQRGILGTLLVQNVALGADPVNVTYQVRRKGKNVGQAVVIGNTTPGPFRVDLTGIGVSSGDLVSVEVSVPAFAGAPPIPKIVFTWFPTSS